MNNLSLALDAIVLIVIVGCCAIGFRRGFIMSVLRSFPIMAALISVRFLTPVMGRFLSGTFILDSLASSINKSMGLDSVASQAAVQTQTEIIGNMNLPSFLEEALLENNNPVVYQLLDVEGLQAYIASFLANICINILSVILVFVVTFLLAKFLLNALNLFGKLPILNFINRMAGLLVGGLKGVCWIWLGGIVLTFLQFHANFLEFFTAMEQTYIAQTLYENNILLYLVLKIFT